MNTVLQAARSAPEILMTQRNLGPSLDWLRSAGIDAPDFSDDRCFFKKAGGVDYSVVSSGDMVAELLEGEAFGLMGADKFGELSTDSSLCFDAVGRLDCRFALLMPKGVEWDGRKPISVATSNPNALNEFAIRRGICLKDVVTPEGKVERWPASGRTDAGFDLVETGKSLAANGLRIVAQDAGIALGGVWRVCENA